MTALLVVEFTVTDGGAGLKLRQAFVGSALETQKSGSWPVRSASVGCRLAMLVAQRCGRVAGSKLSGKRIRSFMGSRLMLTAIISRRDAT